ncbi:hypothetical protein K505DRAFT_376947 [Melanomma pulvis-pyrius CBS 109.77]|uniref:Uncharacterized protein n=1 Tax=Melanomma pulvis-pyrius CBS 109.77 TaxID=1314802 RepID=A0A6A6X4F7_9PLEO|nr:hypothetical protein K505DRAFT_376947 [Melanomma pulvis-pyrius CBS 109.77]
MSNPTKKTPHNPRKPHKLLIPDDEYMSEAISHLLSLSNKISSKNPKRCVYHTAYVASQSAFLQALKPPLLDAIVAWLWEQGISRQTRELVVGRLKQEVTGGYFSLGTMGEKELSEEMGELWGGDVHADIREDSARLLLEAHMRGQVADREGFKERGKREKMATLPAAEKIRGRLKKGAIAAEAGTETDGYMLEYNRRASQNTSVESPYAWPTAPTASRKRSRSTLTAPLAQEDDAEFQGFGRQDDDRRRKEQGEKIGDNDEAGAEDNPKRQVAVKSGRGSLHHRRPGQREDGEPGEDDLL